MKRGAFIFGVLVITLALSVAAYAGEENAEVAVADNSIDLDSISYENSPVNKLGRGVINTATCWAEIPAQMCSVSQKQDPFLGVTLGTVEGVVTTLVRGATGLFDTLTFVIPPYDKPTVKPEYALTHADDKIKEYFW